MRKLSASKILRLVASLLVLTPVLAFGSVQTSHNYSLVFNTTGNLEESCSAEVRRNNTWMVPDGSSLTFDTTQHLNEPAPLARLVLNTNRYNATYRITFTFRDLKNFRGEVLPYAMYIERGSAPLGHIFTGETDETDTYSININFETATAGSGISTYEVATLLMALDEADVNAATAGSYDSTITFCMESI